MHHKKKSPQNCKYRNPQEMAWEMEGYQWEMRKIDFSSAVFCSLPPILLSSFHPVITLSSHHSCSAFSPCDLFGGTGKKIFKTESLNAVELYFSIFPPKGPVVYISDGTQYVGKIYMRAKKRMPLQNPKSYTIIGKVHWRQSRSSPITRTSLMAYFNHSSRKGAPPKCSEIYMEKATALNSKQFLQIRSSEKQIKQQLGRKG